MLQVRVNKLTFILAYYVLKRLNNKYAVCCFCVFSKFRIQFVQTGSGFNPETGSGLLLQN